MPTTKRGSYEFTVAADGRVVDDAANLERLRRLLCDGKLLGDNPDNWGPGDPGDFDHGSWHVFCHLAGGSAVWQSGRDRGWIGLTHVAQPDSYRATLTVSSKALDALRGTAAAAAPAPARAPTPLSAASNVQTVALGSADAKAFLAAGQCVAYIEGTSLGHIAARGVTDDDKIFNKWQRQTFDQGVTSRVDGGTVWEHWCTTRDLRPSSVIGRSVVQGYLTLLSVLGGRFLAAVARGRRDYNHPGQLVAFVKAGLISADEALWDTRPLPIPAEQQDQLYEARPDKNLAAARKLAVSPSDAPKYFMFKRRIAQWSKTDDVRKDLGPLAGGR